MRITLFDNHDSFTWNLAHDLGRFGCQVTVIRDGSWTKEAWSHTDALVVSPGPGLPQERRQLLPVLDEAIGRRMPVLGVCLGMQALAIHFGGSLVNLDSPLHGRSTEISWDHGLSTENGHSAMWVDLPNPMRVGHYHSWIVDERTLPMGLKINARNSEGLPMAMIHESLPVAGVQFHPESVLTPEGRGLLQMWLSSLSPSG